MTTTLCPRCGQITSARHLPDDCIAALLAFNRHLRAVNRELHTVLDELRACRAEDRKEIHA